MLVIVGCNEKNEPGLNDKLKFNSVEYEKSLSIIFGSNDSTDLIRKILKGDLDTLKFVYANRKYQPIFIKSFESKSLVDSLLDILGNVYEHGLNPERYHYNTIKDEFFESIQTNLENKSRYIHLANAELLLSDAILKFSSDMRHGVVNPRKLYADSYFLPVTDSLNKKLFEPLRLNDIIQYLFKIQPKSDKYKKLQAALKHFYSLGDIEWNAIPVSDKKIEMGDSYSSINLVVQKLTVLGFIDTSKIKVNNLSIYDSLLVEPIKEFQKINGLVDDGVIGKTTIERLNITPKDYIEKIKLNLERFRWIDYSDTSRYILVNIPDFKVYAIENEKEKFDIKICTGRKKEWETPNLYGQISYFVLNPTWSVPRSIVEEEIVSGLRKDSSYLKKRNFKAYKSGIQVSLDGLTDKELLSSKSYLLVQDPGLGNALGKIKFMFRNPFGVYLHDTPTRAPFKYVNRAVSHGCMRVEKPIQLAEYLLKDNSRWMLDYLKIEIGQKVDDQNIISDYKRLRNELRKNYSYGVTTEIKLNNPIPLFVDYYTVWVDKDGKLNYRDDVYSRDKILKESLFADD
jgi:murein L,D-transpeptidase YcbB/YkuD